MVAKGALKQLQEAEGDYNWYGGDYNWCDATIIGVEVTISERYREL